MRRFLGLVTAGTIVLLSTNSLVAGVASEAVEQTYKYALRRFGREVAEEGAEAFGGRLARFAAEHGDDGLRAVRQSGPSALRVVREAGEHGPEACRLLGRYGDEALEVAADPRMLEVVRRSGDDAAEAFVKHGRVARPICEQYGAAGARALNRVSPRNATRLGIMAEEGSLARIGRAEDVFALVERSGDKALDFLWRHKGTLAVGTVAAAFWANPDAFLDGAQELVIAPTAQARHTIADGIAGRTNWTVVICGVIAALCLYFTPLLRTVGKLLDGLVRRLGARVLNSSKEKS